MSATTQTTTITGTEIREVVSDIATECVIGERAAGFLVSAEDGPTDLAYVQYLDVDPETVNTELRTIARYLTARGYQVDRVRQSYMGHPNRFLKHLVVTKAVA